VEVASSLKRADLWLGAPTIQGKKDFAFSRIQRGKANESMYKVNIYLKTFS